MRLWESRTPPGFILGAADRKIRGPPFFAREGSRCLRPAAGTRARHSRPAPRSGSLPAVELVACLRVRNPAGNL